MNDFKTFNITLSIVVVILLLLPGVHLVTGGLWLLGILGLWLVYFIQKEEKMRKR